MPVQHASVDLKEWCMIKGKLCVADAYHAPYYRKPQAITNLVWYQTTINKFNEMSLQLFLFHFHGLKQERRNSIVNAMELCLSCTNLSICVVILLWIELTLCFILILGESLRKQYIGMAILFNQ